MTTRDFPLSKEDFISWLRSKNENEAVGLVRTIDECPIVNFFKECRGYTGKVENDCYTTETDDGVIYANPSWVRDFTLDTDNYSDKSLTAREALGWVVNNY